MSCIADSALSNRYMVFDMDGTLIDSNPWLRTISNKYLSKRSLPPNDEFDDMAKGMSLLEYCELLKSFSGDTAPISNTVEEVELYSAQVYNTCDIPAKAYVRDYLKKMKESGVRMCVASATEEILVDTVLTRLELRQYFEFVITVTEVGKNKVNPKIFIEAAKRFGVIEHSAVTVYEDALVAMKSAKSAGFRVVGVHDNAGAKCITEAKKICDLYIDSFEQLMKPNSYIDDRNTI